MDIFMISTITVPACTGKLNGNGVHHALLSTGGQAGSPGLARADFLHNK